MQYYVRTSFHYCKLFSGNDIRRFLTHHNHGPAWFENLNTDARVAVGLRLCAITGQDLDDMLKAPWPPPPQIAIDNPCDPAAHAKRPNPGPHAPGTLMH